MISALLFAATLLGAPMNFSHAVLHAPKAQLLVEVADTGAKRERGLMNRLYLGRHRGMIFVFDRDAEVTFWMKNTLVPLDMVFVAGDGRVRSVAKNVPRSFASTRDEDVARRNAKAKFVLELNAGEAAMDGLAPGAALTGLAGLRAGTP